MFLAMEIKIKRLNKEAILPKYANSGDAGLDLYSCEDKLLKPGERYAFKTGLAMEIPKGYVGLVWDKSGLSSNHGLHTFAGVGDSGYRGEWQIIISNLSDSPYAFEKGDKIAQLLIQKVEHAKIIEADILNETQRGEGGFGASGKK
jgi:dUTP pyrophosphatase